MKARVIVAACACAVTAASAAPAHAAIALRGVSTNNTGASRLTSLTINAPTGLAAGDVMVATIAIRVNANTISAPAGWAPVAGITNADTQVREASFWKVATALDVGASFSFTIGGTVTLGTGGIAAYSGVDTANALDFSATGTSAGTSSTTATAPAITTANLRAAVIVAVAWQGGVTITRDPRTAERYATASTDSTAGNNVSLEMADLTQAAPGSTGTFSVTANGSGKWVASTIALNEMPSLTASFPSDYAWPALVPGATATSPEQTISVTSNRAWGVQLSSDRSDGRARQWDGSAYGTFALTNPLQWRTSSIAGNAQATSFANLSGTAGTAVTSRPAAAGAVAVGVTFRQPVSYADEAALPAGNTYRQNVSYTAQQGF